MHFLKNKKIFFLHGLIVFLLVGCVPISFEFRSNRHIKVSDAIIHYSYCNFGLIAIPFQDGKYFILDTGATRSAVLRNRTEIRSSFRGLGLLNRERTVPIRTARSVQIGDLLIENFNFVYLRARNTLWENDTTIVGVIGMDVFSEIHSYFDIKNQTITFSNERKNKTELPSFVLSYENPIRPLVDLYVNGIVFEDVLFDIGSDGFLGLLKTDKDVLNLDVEPRIGTNRDILNNEWSFYRKTPYFIEVNDVKFATSTVSYSRNRLPRLLGMRFVKQFSSFLIDPFEKKIKFFE